MSEKLYECKSPNCKRKFDEQEYKLTNDKNKCILHCEKNDYSNDWKSGLLEKFFLTFIEYVLNHIFEDNYIFSQYDLLKIKAKKEQLRFDLLNRKYEKSKFDGITFVPSHIHFPTIDRRDRFNYLNILNLFEEIHFNYCEFYLSSLNLINIKCFFQDCLFHNRWTLYNYDLLENEDNVIYQTCIFNGNISNYTPEKLEELAVYNHTQFDYTCEFKDSIEFERVKFNEMLFNTNQYNYLDEQNITKLKFKNCTFIKKFRLNNYNISEFISKDCFFENKFEFKENKIIEFYIYNSNFSNVTDLYGCEFKKLNIEKSIFDSFVGFENCVFGTKNKLKEEITLFKHATFKDTLNARGSKFLSGLNIKNINLQGESNFLDADIEIENSNRETFRIIKHSFDRIGNIIEANKFYALEMKKREDELSEKIKSKEKTFNDILDYIVFKAHGLASNHSQEWLLSLLLIFIFGIGYSIFIFDNLNSTNNNELLEIIAKYANSSWQIYLKWIFISSSVISFFIAMFYKDLIFKYLCICLVLVSFYIGYTKDITFSFFAYNVNPFSIMHSNDTLTGGTLIFKITIAYLIYQLIISIRQNTRRK